MEGNKKRLALFVLSATAAIMAGVFCHWTKLAHAETLPNIIITEILPDPEGDDKLGEFIELHNSSNNSIDLAGCSLTNRTGNAFIFPNDSLWIVGPGEYLAIYYNESRVTLHNSGGESVELRDPDGNIISTLYFSGTARTGESFGLIDDEPVWISISTPGEENCTTDEEYDNSEQDDDTCTTLSENILLNEIFPYPKSGDEFVEIANNGEECIDVSGWKIMDEASHKINFPEESIIYPDEYLILEGNLYLNNDSDSVYLLDTAGKNKDDSLDSVSYDKAQKDFSYSFDGEGWLWTPVPTPEEENNFDESADSNNDEENYTFSEGVYFNEILPNPKKGSDNEYIEIKNDGNATVDLYGWILRDVSKSGKYEFKKHKLVDPGAYFVIYRADSKLALNNSDETIFLYDPDNTLISSISWEKSQRNASYNRDDDEWRWSKYLTPGEKNKFDSEPSVKIKKPKHAYKNFYTEFSVKAKDKETKDLKFVWDFGDDRKSYLENPTHKYLDTGKYKVTLSVADDSQTVEKGFTLNVKKYPIPDLEIVKIVPNPEGNDSEGEIIDIRNNSSKDILLDGWKIATGSTDKLANHPITDEITLAAGGTMTITREISRFTLNNKRGKIQLLAPDGSLADEVNYEKTKIAEDEAYVKINGAWQWIMPGSTPDQPNNQTTEQPAILGAIDIISPHYDPRFTSEDAYIFLSQINFFHQPEELNYTPIYDPSSTFAYLIASLI